MSDNAVYAALSAHQSNFNELSIAANNVANLPTDGYKSGQSSFQQYLTQDVKDVLTLPQDKTVVVDYKQGSLRTTGQSLDFAIHGEGFFVVQTPMGMRYTRSGSFLKDDQGVLVTKQGYPVMSTNNDQITLGIDDETIVVEAKGTIYAKSKNGTMGDRGTILVVDFPNKALLKKAGDTMFFSEVVPVAAADMEPVTQNAIVSNNTVRGWFPYRVVQGSLEESNVNQINAMNELRVMQIHIQSLSSLPENIYSANMALSRYSSE